jgi:hypothetical protein
LRGTETDVPAVLRSVLRALQLAEEDLQKWCGNLSDAEVNVRPAGADAGGANLEEARTVGKKRLPTTVGGLLVHVADHTQRHVGQAITAAKVVVGVGVP